jgi:hypothetical protein
MSTGIVPLPSITETEIFLAPTSVPRCAETRAWKELIALTKFGMMRTGGLGHLMIDDEMEVWMCVQKGECLGDIYNLAINVASPDHYKLPEWVVTYKEHLHHALAGGSSGNSSFLEINNNFQCKQSCPKIISYVNESRWRVAFSRPLGRQHVLRLSREATPFSSLGSQFHPQTLPYPLPGPWKLGLTGGTAC